MTAEVEEPFQVASLSHQQRQQKVWCALLLWVSAHLLVVTRGAVAEP